jgi:NAD(P)-dependent dehydrogenase (short-subunit alcohol dehydrogenase family)
MFGEKHVKTNRMALILGATGGIGGETAHAIARHGWKIRALSRNGRPSGTPASWEWVKGDFSSRETADDRQSHCADRLANMDIRSFTLNAEINLIVYDLGVARQLRAVRERDFPNSDRLEPATRKCSLGARIIQNTARLMDSFL